MNFNELDTVTAARDLPRQLPDEQAVPAGTIGAVTSVLSDSAGTSYEVEFIDDDGYTLALMVLGADDISLLPEPVSA
jgi:hypothetical protein